MEDQRAEEAWFQSHRDEVEEMRKNCCSNYSFNQQQRIEALNDNSSMTISDFWILAVLGLMSLYNTNDVAEKDDALIDQ